MRRWLAAALLAVVAAASLESLAQTEALSASSAYASGEDALEAGRALADQYAYQDALEAYREAEALFDAAGRPAEVAEAQMAQATMAGVLGDAVGAFAISQKILADADAAPSTPRFRAAIFMASTFTEVGDPEAARQMLALAGAMVEAVDFAPAQSTFAQGMAHLEFSERNYVEAIDWARRALAAIDEDAAARRAFPKIWLGRSLTASGRPAEALPWLEEAVEDAERGGHVLAVVMAEYGRAEAASALGDLETARSATDAMMQAANAFERDTGEDYFDVASKLADMLMLYAQVREGVSPPEDTARHFERAYQAMSRQYDRLRDDSVAFYRAQLDALRLESSLALAQQREAAALDLARARQRGIGALTVLTALAAGLAGVALVLWRRTVRQRSQLKSAFDDRGVLIRELHHRTQNNLQLISSLIRFEKRADEQPSDDLLVQRVLAMASVNQRLVETGETATIEARGYLGDIVRDTHAGLGRLGVTVNTSIEDVFLDVDVASALGLILAEMLVNAYKHGLSTDAGALDVTLARGEGGAWLEVINTLAPGSLDTPPGSGSGFGLIQALADQIGAACRFKRSDGVFVWRLEGVPIAAPPTAADP
ncbi:MAG: histidine kinase dimerization/phosphoacceptor domain -containing protein [Pseudomonadota bacterium]